MAANVESMFYVRKTPWHGLGTRVEEAPSSQEALILAGLNWNVVQKSIRTEDGIPVSGFQANIRDTDHQVLGVVTDRYRIVQNHEAFAFTDSLLGEGVTYETAGSLQSGRRVWVLAKLPQHYIISGDEIIPYLVFMNAHNGTEAIKAAMAPIRVVCQNTLNLALSTAKRSWSTNHVGDIQGKLEDARYTLLYADLYMKELKKQSIHPEVIKHMAKDIKIVYTPLHGTGNLPVRRVLKELGFENVYVVPEQEKPDGNFPTVAYPNPESPKAFELALKLAKEKDADIVLATDPDADRLGVYCKDTKSGEYVTFTGNMSGMLIAEYILRERTSTNTMPENPALVETIVTTDMAKAIAKAYGVTLIEVLTGFKYIGEQIKWFEETGNHNYVFGLEESYGCLAGTYARDKDACVAVMMLCEVASWYKAKNMTLWDAMLQMYEKYGYYKECLETMTLKGKDGAKQINDMMTKMRENPPKELAGLKVLAVRDYKEDTRKDLSTGEMTKTGLPSSNVLYYELSNNSWCCVRPSGTEPKIKFYFGVVGENLQDGEAKLNALNRAMLEYAEGGR